MWFKTPPRPIDAGDEMKRIGCYRAFLCILFTTIFMSGCVTTKREVPDKSKKEEVKRAEIVKGKIGRDGAPMVLIPAGEFMMGSPAGEGYDCERPQHRVYLDAYYIDKYEVTVEQYRNFCEATGRSMPSAPSWGWIDSHPIVNVTWEDASAYVKYYGKRLPTEGEWEKASRAGNSTKYCYGDDERRLGEYAWYYKNRGSGKRTQPVGQKKPNAWGLNDMHGNVWEWCSNWYGADYYKNSPDTIRGGPNTGSDSVFRGGCWNASPDSCRSARRGWDSPTSRYDFIGFRCAASVAQ